jgi:lipopolysaccharide transport system permease protein
MIAIFIPQSSIRRRRAALLVFARTPVSDTSVAKPAVTTFHLLGPSPLGAPNVSMLREFFEYRELVWALALKELRIRYKRSSLGFLWALLNPLLMMLILTAVFSTVMRIPVRNYAVFLISALLPWTFFSQALTYSAESIVGNGELLKKVAVPKAVFPVAAVISNSINFALSLIPLVLILALLHFPFHLTWVLMPIPFIALVLFTMGCGFLFAAANVYYRDVSHIVQLLLSAWFYLSPVIYSLDFVPARFQPFFKLNPMLYLLEGFRGLIYYGAVPSWHVVAASLLLGGIALVIGFFTFARYQDSFVFYV